MRSLIIAFLLAATLGAAQAKPAQQPQVLAATPEQAQAAIWSARFLSRLHYHPVALDEAMSRKIFDRYLKSLDGDRLFFVAADIERFGRWRDTLDKAIYDEDLAPPFIMFQLYQQRVAERTAHARALLAKGFDFDIDEYYQLDRSEADWAADSKALDDLWRMRVKNDWLRLKLADKDDDDIRQTLDKRYATYLDRVRELNGEDVFQTFMNAYAMSIEPHTTYLGPRASENFDIAMRLSLEGVGASLQREDDYTAVRQVIPGGPAALDGRLKIGDRIIGVGQGKSGEIVDVVGWRLDDVVELIRGKADTIVRLEVLPADAGLDGDPVILELVRKKVSIEEQAARKSIIEVRDGERTWRVGVLSLPTFYHDFAARRRGEKDYRSATRDAERLLVELKQDKVDGVLVDLRNNGGGSLTEATDLTGLFIDRGPVVQVRNAAGRVEVEQDQNAGMAWEGPLAVLVNRASASASEIFAAAIQDYGRGIVLGQGTFGKGTVQNLVDLDRVAHNDKPEFGELKMTIAQFFRISGGSTQLRGVTPDVGFPQTMDPDDYGESSYDNALPWTSIAPASYKPLADLKGVLPVINKMHEERTAANEEWQYFVQDLEHMRELRNKKQISLREDVRRSEREAAEARRKARLAREAAAAAKEEADGSIKVITSDADTEPADADAEVESDNAEPIDDGLHAGERSIKDDLEREESRKQRRDVLLIEASQVLADLLGLLDKDRALAADVQPWRAAVGGN